MELGFVKILIFNQNFMDELSYKIENESLAAFALCLHYMIGLLMGHQNLCPGDRGQNCLCLGIPEQDGTKKKRPNNA